MQAVVAICQFCTCVVGIGIIWAWANAVIIIYTGGTNSDGKNILPIDSRTSEHARSPENVFSI